MRLGAAGIGRTFFALQHFEDDFCLELGSVLTLIGDHVIAPLLDSVYSLLTVQFWGCITSLDDAEAATLPCAAVTA